MSAIIAGDKCAMCGESYRTSFGHFKGYDERTGNMFREYMILKRKGICTPCHLLNEHKRMSKNQEMELPLLTTVIVVSAQGALNK